MQPSGTELDDDSTSTIFNGHLSAIHALMAISVPTGYQEMTSRKIEIANMGNLQAAMTDIPHDALERSSPVISSIKAEEQQQGKFVVQDYKADEVYDPYSILKSLDALPDFGLTKVRKCRYDSCEDEVALLSIDDKLLSRGLVMEDIMYNSAGFCRKHLFGTKKCEYDGCDKCAQGSTKFCIKHGG